MGWAQCSCAGDDGGVTFIILIVNFEKKLTKTTINYCLSNHNNCTFSLNMFNIIFILYYSIVCILKANPLNSYY